jgi:hypothetical protein
VIKTITIEVIPHSEQRYNTVGDWQFTRDAEGNATSLSIRVSDISDGRYHALIAVHELVEALLCHNHGITEADVDKFDMNWEPDRISWEDDRRYSEPGEDWRAPYYPEHQTASAVERILASALRGVNWEAYCLQVDLACEQNIPSVIEDKPSPPGYNIAHDIYPDDDPPF